jgi:hypothetical protein
VRGVGRCASVVVLGVLAGACFDPPGPGATAGVGESTSGSSSTSSGAADPSSSTEGTTGESSAAADTTEAPGCAPGAFDASVWDGACFGP